jgi:tetratricopeptide (TPR) repeat protein
VVLMAVGRPGDALTSFERAMDADPVDPIAVYNLALAQIALNDRSGALDSLAEAIALNPDYFDVYLSRAWLYEEDKHLDAALADLDRACSLRPEVSVAFLRRANTLAKLRRWKEALRDYDTTLQLDPHNYIAHLHPGNICRELALGRTGHRRSTAARWRYCCSEISHRDLLPTSGGGRTG